MPAYLEAIIFALSGVLHGISGMGFPMVTTGVLAMSMTLPQAVALVALPTLLMNGLVLCTKNRKGLFAELYDYGRRYFWLALMSVVGGAIGVKLLLVLPAHYLYLLMASVTLYYVGHGLLSLLGKAKPLSVPTGNLSMATFGLLAGAIGGATNAMSPILLIYLMSKCTDRTEIAKASNLCYLLSKVVQIYLLKDIYGNYTPSEYGQLAVLTVLSMVGLFLGIWLRSKLSGRAFNYLVYFILLGLAIKIAYNGVIGLLTN